MGVNVQGQCGSPSLFPSVWISQLEACDRRVSCCLAHFAREDVKRGKTVRPPVSPPPPNITYFLSSTQPIVSLCG